MLPRQEHTNETHSERSCRPCSPPFSQPFNYATVTHLTNMYSALTTRAAKHWKCIKRQKARLLHYNLAGNKIPTQLKQLEQNESMMVTQ